MKIYPFKAHYPDLDLITSPESFFSSVKLNYTDFIESGFYQMAQDKAFYIYQISSASDTDTGLIADIHIDDYATGNVLPHEKTLTANEQEMMSLMLKRKAMIKPVLLGYEGNAKINKALSAYINNNKPTIKTTFEITHIEHRIWRITSPSLISELYTHFDNIAEVFIADGHHRCSTFNIFNINKSKYDSRYNFENLLCAFFPINELNIYSYNRVFALQNDITYSQLIARLSKFVNIKSISKPREPRHPREMVLVFPQETYEIKWKKSVLNAHKSNILDTRLFNTYLLKKALGITNIRDNQRVKYVKGTLGYAGVFDKVMKKERGVGFILYPVDVKDFKQIAQRHKVLPPKSTWFEPRLINGLITQAF